ncbi:MAG: RidA family protein [Gemmatimonadetes bacterium]|nr:RidA family protein [Gemmatimonadota bacterium]
MNRTGSIHTADAPAAVGPYSQGYWAGELFFSAGQVGLDPGSGEMVGEDVETQAARVMDNLDAVLTEAGVSFADVVKTTIFLADMGDFSTVNEIYAARFEPPYPARSTVAVKTLPKDALVEIEVIARKAG